MNRLSSVRFTWILSAIVLFGVCALVALSGCSRSRKIEKKIIALIAHSCPDRASCRIRVDQATSFNWDRLYVFKYTATEKDREQALGMKDDGYRDLERQLVFLKNGKIVFQESEPTNVEHPIKDEVVFDIPDAAAFKSYANGAEFSVTQVTGESGPHYQLSQVR
jgi:hypothetical protein